MNAKLAHTVLPIKAGSPLAFSCGRGNFVQSVCAAQRGNLRINAADAELVDQVTTVFNYVGHYYCLGICI